MGRRRNKGRKVNGILLLDKPAGITSNEALQQVKWLFRAAKAGHTGSLDPLATGLLPVCLGEATKLSAFLLDADKRYRVRVRLGETTTTADAEGELVKTASTEGITAPAIAAVLATYRGPIQQMPPMYSALKHKGERLYKLARQGIEVERELRRVEIHAIELLDVSMPEFEMDVHCSKGTYVRTLADDIGNDLGCGAHVIALRRTGVGPYGQDNMHTIETLESMADALAYGDMDACLLPLESALANWPDVRLSGDAAFYLQKGQPVLVPQAPTAGLVRLYDQAGDFLGVGRIQDDGKVAPKRLMHGRRRI